MSTIRPPIGLPAASTFNNLSKSDLLYNPVGSMFFINVYSPVATLVLASLEFAISFLSSSIIKSTGDTSRPRVSNRFLTLSFTASDK